MPYGYFPSQNRVGDYLGQGISAFAQNFLAARTAKRQRQQEEKDRDRATAIQNAGLAQQGITLFPTNALPPDAILRTVGSEAVNAGMRGVPESAGSVLDSAFQRGMQQSLMPKPGEVPDVSPTVETPRPGPDAMSVFQRAMQGVGPAEPQPHYTFGQGFAIDNTVAQRKQEAEQRSAFQRAMLSALPGILTREQQPKKLERIVGADGRVVFYDPTNPELPEGFRAPGQSTAGPRNIDPLSPEGIAAAVERERRLAGIKATEPKTPEPPKPAEFEKKAAFMLEGAESAARTLDGYSPGARTFVSKIPGFGNYGLSAEDQIAQQAAETMYDAYLRLTTGATIAPEELKNAAKQFVPQPGDTRELLQAKRERRAQILRAMRSAAQPALQAQGRTIAEPSGDTGGVTLPPLTTGQIAKAKADPDYAAFLRDKGYAIP